jgi:hypothetical protein
LWWGTPCIALSFSLHLYYYACVATATQLATELEMFGSSTIITSSVYSTTCILCSLHYCIIIQIRLQYNFPLFTSAFTYCPLLCQILLL